GVRAWGGLKVGLWKVAPPWTSKPLAVVAVVVPPPVPPVGPVPVVIATVIGPVYEVSTAPVLVSAETATVNVLPAFTDVGGWVVTLSFVATAAVTLIRLVVSGSRE